MWILMCILFSKWLCSIAMFSCCCAETEQVNTSSDYLTFLIWVLEYRSIIIEQLGHEREQAYLDSLTPEQRKQALDESIEYSEPLTPAGKSTKSNKSNEDNNNSESDSGIVSDIGGMISNFFWGSEEPAATSQSRAQTSAAIADVAVAIEQVEEPPAHLRPYGQIVEYIVIRDLAALGLDHIGTDGKEIISAVIAVASDNFPGAAPVRAF
jgi:hypothetical protein